MPVVLTMIPAILKANLWKIAGGLLLVIAIGGYIWWIKDDLADAQTELKDLKHQIELESSKIDADVSNNLVDKNKETKEYEGKNEERRKATIADRSFFDNNGVY